MDMNEVLDFGEDAVTDVDSKLKILKFDYSWADAVEEHERRLEAQKQQEEMDREIKNKTNDNRREETVLDFGDEAVTDWRSKLQILKFEYSWAERVEEEEKKITQEANIVGQKMNMEIRRSRTTQQIDTFSERGQEKKRAKTAVKRRDKFQKIKQENAGNEGIAQKQVTLEEKIAVDLETAEKQSPPEGKNGHIDPGLAVKQVSKEKRTTAAQNKSLKQVIPEEENTMVPKCYEMHVAINLNISEEKKVQYPESNELFEQGHTGNKTASKQEAEETEVSILKEVIEERKVADPESCGIAMKQETPGNRKITVIQELLNEDKVDEDNGEDEDDEDGLFGPRRLFFFGVDYFKTAEKSAW